jgi:tetratricopeptide (TPR) repeat protein
MAPPLDRGARAVAVTIAMELQHVAAREHALALDGLLARARAVIADARALGHGPTLAAALAELARVELSLGNGDDAARVLRELAQVAASSHDDRDEAYAWTRLLGVLADKGQVAESRALRGAALAAVHRAGDPVDLQADLLFEEGASEHYTDRVRDGLAELRRARALLEGAGAERPTSPLASRYPVVVLEEAVLLFETGDHDAAFATFDHAIALFRALYGPDSMAEGYVRNDLGESYRRAGRYDDALGAYGEAIRILRARGGSSGSLAQSLGGRAETFSAMRRWDDARAAFEETIEMDRALHIDGDPTLDYDRSGLATALAHLGRRGEAQAIFDDALGTLDRSATGSNLALVHLARGELELDDAQCDRALADFQRAVDLLEQVGGPKDGWLIAPLVGEGRCLLSQRRPGAAVAPLSRAAALTPRPETRRAALLARFYVDRALVEAGRDRSRVADAETARAQIADANAADPDELARIDRWLAVHAPRAR